MSEVTASEWPDNLVEYLEQLNNFIYETGGAEGLMVPLSRRVFEDTFRERVDLTSDKNPFKLFRFVEKENNWSDVLLNKVIELMKTGVPTKNFGMSFLDMMELDYPTFRDIQTAVNDIIKNKNSAVDEVKDELENEE